MRSLRAYREPWRSSAAALADVDTSIEQMLSLPLTAIAESGEVAGIAIHPEAQVFLRAQRLVRSLEGASPTDPLISKGARYVETALRAAGQDLNLAVAPAGDVRSRRRAHRWKHQNGVVVQPVSGPARPGKDAD